MGKRLFLEPFVQRVRRCQRCQRFGHLSKFCKTPDTNACCVRCGETLSSSHDDTKCKSDNLNCINCKRHKLSNRNHEASSATCPIFIRQQKIKKIAAYHNVFPAEAEDLLSRKGDNPSGGGG